MNISFNFNNLTARAGKNIGLILGALLLVLIVLEGLIVQQSLAILLSAGRIEPTPKTQLVRVNFTVYDSIAKRFDIQGAFLPTVVLVPNPFGVIDTTPPKP